MNKILIVFGLIFILVLAACGGEVSGSAAAAGANGSSGSTAQSGDAVRLSEDYSDALPVQSQLAIGTLQLEDSDMAVDEAMATELLPLWRAAQSLANSETAAEAEVTAVLNQIQDTMNPDQVAAIVDMELTQESFQTMLEEGTISLGRGAFAGGPSENDEGRFPGGFGGGPGGPGGGVPGGGGPGGGFPGGFGGDPSAVETRMAERGIEGGLEELQASAMTSAVIRLLEEKTGEVSDRAFGGGPMIDAITAVAEATDLSAEDVQAAMAEGHTLAEIVAENGGDLDAVKAKLIESLSASEFLQDQDPEVFVTSFLEGGGFPAPPRNE